MHITQEIPQNWSVCTGPITTLFQSCITSLIAEQTHKIRYSATGNSFPCPIEMGCLTQRRWHWKGWRQMKQFSHTLQPSHRLQQYKGYRDYGNSMRKVDSKGFWQWCITLRIPGFLDFVHSPVFLKVETQCFENCICFRPQVREGRHLLSWVP
jgi:hypothetical protein